MIQRGGSIGSVIGGLIVSTDCQVTAGSGMQVAVGPGEAIIPGSSAASQGGYYARVSSSTTLTIATSDPSSPRIDRVSAIIKDKGYAGTEDTFTVAVQTGTPTPGATLVNLSGVAAAPASSLTLGYVLVPAASVSISGGNISNVAAPLTAYGTSLWTALTLGTGITAAGFTPAVRSEGPAGSLLRFKGQLVNNSGGSIAGGAVLATAPAPLRPFQGVSIYTSVMSNGTVNTLGIATSGAITAAAPLPTTVAFALDGLAIATSNAF